MRSGRTLPIVIGLVIAILLQVLVAPIVRIGFAMPDFVLAYVIALAFADRDAVHVFVAFFGGLAYDLLGSNPLGSMALVCVVAMFACSMAMRMLESDGIVIPIILIIVACLLFETAYGLLLMACGIDVALLDAFAYRALPCAVYDMVIATIAYLLMVRFVLRGRDTGGMTIIDNGVS